MMLAQDPALALCVIVAAYVAYKVLSKIIAALIVLVGVLYFSHIHGVTLPISIQSHLSDGHLMIKQFIDL